MRATVRAKGEKKYTWQDYLTWPDDERWEVIDGAAYDMTPSPSFQHQKVAGNFYRVLRDRVGKGPCIAAIAPLDVYLDDVNFVQPDVLVVCDEKKIRDRIYGAPDLVVEVLSPSTSVKDRREKKNLYEKFGVREYVIVHPEEMLVERFFLNEGRFRGRMSSEARKFFLSCSWRAWRSRCGKSSRFSRPGRAKERDPVMDIRRILAIKLRNLGDVLLAVPALRAIRESHRGEPLRPRGQGDGGDGRGASLDRRSPER